MRFVTEQITNTELAIPRMNVKTRVAKLAEAALKDMVSVVPSKWAAERADLKIALTSR